MTAIIIILVLLTALEACFAYLVYKAYCELKSRIAAVEEYLDGIEAETQDNSDIVDEWEKFEKNFNEGMTNIMSYDMTTARKAGHDGL